MPKKTDEQEKIEEIFRKIDSHYWRRVSIREELTIFLRVVAGMLLLSSYIAAWVGLYYLIGGPWYLYLIPGASVPVALSIYTERRKRCVQCGSRSLRVVTHYTDAGYIIADILKCSKCNLIQSDFESKSNV